MRFNSFGVAARVFAAVTLVVVATCVWSYATHGSWCPCAVGAPGKPPVSQAPATPQSSAVGAVTVEHPTAVVSAKSAGAAASPKVADKPAATEAAEVDLPVRFGAEFEEKDATIIGCNEFEFHEKAITQILSALDGKAPVLALVSGMRNRDHVLAAIEDAKLEGKTIHIHEMALDSMWVRDYGPKFVIDHGTLTAVDTHYVEEERTKDNNFVYELSGRLGYKVTTLRINLAGGNLISNGRGHGLTTSLTEIWNEKLGVSRQQLTNYLGNNYGFKAVSFLEPLQGEPTGHADMFSTFVKPNMVVVGKYDADYDSENAAVLDRNAKTLAEAKTATGPLTVKRIPMPPHTEELWPTYTNVIYANGTLLVPNYPSISPDLDKVAVKFYQELLPDWNVVPIDCTSLIHKRGALHCISLGITKVDPKKSILSDVPTAYSLIHR